MKIPFDKAFKMLEDSAAVIVSSHPERPVTYASLNDHEIIVATDENCDYYFQLEDNPTVEFEAPVMTLKEEGGQLEQLTLLVPLSSPYKYL